MLRKKEKARWWKYPQKQHIGKQLKAYEIILGQKESECQIFVILIHYT